MKMKLLEIRDDQTCVEDGRHFIDIARTGDTYRWKFITIDASPAAESEPSGIRLVFSNNPQDLSLLPQTCRLVYDGVLHCLPHSQRFVEPVVLSLALPESVGLSAVRVLYSNTDLGDVPRHWTMMDQDACSRRAEIDDESSSSENRATLLANTRELLLVLKHFCIFAIVVNGEEERAQNVAVNAFLKVAVSACRYSIDVLVIVGCDSDNCNKRDEMAMHSGYKHVEQTDHIMFENAGDVTVKVDNITWMNDFALQPLSFTQDKHSLWRGAARPNLFQVTSEAAVRSGVDSHFSCDVHIQQPDRTALVFRLSQDLHEVYAHTPKTRTTGGLPHCNCGLCHFYTRAVASATSATEPMAGLHGGHESVPSQCQADCVDDQRLLSQSLRSDNSSSDPSLCCRHDDDYAEARALCDADGTQPKLKSLKNFDDREAIRPLAGINPLQAERS